MRKELRPVHDQLSCAVCGRTILKGERTESYLAPGGHRHLVCDLCFTRAEQEGWIRESAHGDAPAARGPARPRRSLFGRLRRRRPAPAPAPEAPERFEELVEGDGGPPPAAEPAYDPNGDEPPPAPEPPRRVERPREPRHVRGVPTNAEVKVERAVELFNASDHPRTIAGIARSLGEPWVSAGPTEGAPSEVSLIVAWELSWYRYRVDLGSEADPVHLVDKGQELEELPPEAREWNASADADGYVVVGVGSEQ